MKSTTFKILILEDDDDLREMLADVLDEQGYEVTAVATGEEAISFAAGEAFDLFIADIRMEGMGGLKAIEEARDHQKELGSLVISGWASEEETLEAVRLQVGGYLKKPFSMSDLIDRVKSLLTARHEQLRREREKELLRSTALWSLETLARVSDQAGFLAPRGALLKIESVAGMLADLCDLDPIIVQQVRVGASVAALVDIGNIAPPEMVEKNSALHPLFEVLKGYKQSVTQAPDTPLTSQIAGLALAVALRDPDEELPDLQWIQDQYPHRFSESLLAKYQTLQERFSQSLQPAPEMLLGLRSPTSISRSLLSVAKTMEACGDPRSAWSAYLKLLEGEGMVREATAACLGLARLAIKQKDLQASAKWALEAPRRAKPLGPSAFGQAALGCGLILQEIGHEQAEASLTAAVRVLEKIGLVGSAAIAKIALDDHQDLERTLQILANPAHWDQVSTAAPRILPKLLERWSDGSPWPIAERLILAFSDLLIAREDTLSSTAKDHLLTILEKRPKEVPATLIEGLASSADPNMKARACALQSVLKGKEGSPFLRIHSLGFFELHLGGTAIDDQRWRTQKTKYLVAYLLSKNGKPCLSEELVDLFWPDSRAKAEQNLWAATTAARRVLKPGSYLLREGDTLSFDWDAPYWHDYEELNKALLELSHLNPANDLESFASLSQKIAQLYTGPYLDGCYMDWAVRLRGHLEVSVSQALVSGSHCFLRLRRYAEALEMATRAMEVEPFRGETFLMKMRAHLGLGQPELTISTFQEGALMLKREFELEPPTSMLEVSMRAKNGLPDSGD